MMTTLETSINIKTSAEKVWFHLMDWQRYGDWNPLIKSIKGKPVSGEYLEVMIQPEGMSAQQFNPELLELETNKALRWRGKLGMQGIFDGEHYFRLEELDEKTTKLIHGEHFTGVLVKPLLWLIGKATEQGFISMNKALKQISEVR